MSRHLLLALARLLLLLILIRRIHHSCEIRRGEHHLLLFRCHRLWFLHFLLLLRARLARCDRRRLETL